MATLEARLIAFAQRVATEFKNLRPRLVPTGGLTGQVLTKTSNTDNATGWTALTLPPQGVSAGIQGKTTASEVIPLGIAPYSFTPTTSGSSAIALTAASSQTVFSIRQGSTTIGSIVFSASATVGIFQWTSGVTKGEALNILCPSTPDAALADLHLFIGA